MRFQNPILLYVLILMPLSLLQVPTYGDVDTLAYLYRQAEIGEGEALVFRKFLNPRCDALIPQNESEQDSILKIWDKVWDGYITVSMINHSLPFDSNTAKVYNSLLDFIITNKHFYHGIRKIESTMLHENPSLLPYQRYDLLLWLSILYDKYGYMNLSRNIILENLSQVLLLGNDNLTLNYYQVLCNEYYHLYETHSRFESEFHQINNHCYELSQKTSRKLQSAIFYLNKAYFDTDDNVDNYYYRALHFLDPSNESYKKQRDLIGKQYLTILFFKNLFTKFHHEISKILSDSQIARSLIWSTRMSKVSLASDKKYEGKKYLDIALSHYPNEKDVSIKRASLVHLPDLCESYGLHQEAYLLEEDKEDIFLNQLISESFGEQEIHRYNVELHNKEEKINKQKNILNFLLILLIICLTTGIMVYRLYKQINKKSKHINQTLAELSTVNKSLESANKDIEAFAYTAAHDLKNPLQSVAGFLQLLKDSEADNMTMIGNSYFFSLDRNLENLSLILKNVIDYARLNGNIGSMEKFDIESSILKAAKSISEIYKDSSVDILLKGEFPSCIGYPDLMSQLALNLISNSVKYKNPGRKARVEIISQKLKDEFHIHFSDNGKGIADKEFEQITALLNGGTYLDLSFANGVGLSIVKKIVDIHQAKISLKNNFGNGVTFTLILPMVNEVKYKVA